MSGKTLTEIFAELVELHWSEFLTLEQNGNISNRQSVVVSLIRACVGGSMRAIQTALDRLDGVVEDRVEVILPKFYYRYPFASSVEGDDSPPLVAPSTEPVLALAQAQSESELPSGKLRPVLERMLEAPRTTALAILASQQLLDKGESAMNDPYVKSVIVSALLGLAHTGKMGAVLEVFDQIDGKIAKVLHVMGDDVYVDSYLETAPVGAVLNEDGIYQIEATNITTVWQDRLEGGRGARH
jgi:hypothetical protein